MKLFDFFRRKKTIEKIKEAEKTAEREKPAFIETAAGKKKTRKPKEELPAEKTFSKSKRTKHFSYDVIKGLHISEKATNLAEKNHYVFKVLSGASKTEIKKAVEGIYGVDVLSVSIIKIPAKKRRLGRVPGFKRGHIKAIVKIGEGQKIEIL